MSTPSPFEPIDPAKAKQGEYIAYYEPDVMEYAMWGHIVKITKKGLVKFVTSTGKIHKVDPRFVTYDIEVGHD